MKEIVKFKNIQQKKINLLKLSLFFILFFIITFSTWLSFSTNHSIQQNHTQEENKLDSFATEVHLTNMDKTGHISTQLYTPKLTHSTTHNLTQLEHPQVTIYTQNQPPWTVSAKQGTIHHDTQSVFLENEVTLHQSKGNNNEEVTVDTDALTVYPEKKIATTELPITLSSHSTHINSIGMQADLSQGTLELKNQAKGEYKMPAAKS